MPPKTISMVNSLNPAQANGSIYATQYALSTVYKICFKANI
jgi:hypothetical protein